MLQIATRADRNLAPYQSPQKEWDILGLAPTFEVLVAAEPSTRQFRRQRQRDLASMGRKSRRTAARQAFQRRQLEQNARGMARVYLRDAGTPDMRHNVTQTVHRMAEERSKATGQPWTSSIKEVEGKLMTVLFQYGDDL